MSTDNPILNNPCEEPGYRYATNDDGEIDYAQAIDGRRTNITNLTVIPSGSAQPATIPTIVDNRGENTLLAALRRMGGGGRELWIASAFFSLDALMMLGDVLAGYERVRILFGDDSSAKQRQLLLERLRRDSDSDLLTQRSGLPLLSPLGNVEELFRAGRIEARCYTRNKFHAKAYYIVRPDVYPSQMAVIGSGNFTRPGLVQNVELNVELTPEQTAHLRQWYEDRWAEAIEDVVTEDVLAELRRQIDLYDPHIIYLKALYAWGQYRQGEGTDLRPRMLSKLDKHQEDGYFQALRIIQREHGVMICDGVGLGKSFIALALIERFCRGGSNVLLLAPKNILDNSWQDYLRRYLRRERSRFGNIVPMAMTALGFDPPDGDFDDTDILEHIDGDRETVMDLFENADLVVIDESHNFRSRPVNRYQNLFRILAPNNGRRKKVIMLTATPINTHYADISSQLGLITHESGAIGGYSIEKIRAATRELDKDEEDRDFTGQLSLQLGETPNDTLNRVLESVVIQRSRATCRELSRAAGRELRFPRRSDPVVIDYTIGEQSRGYADLIELADRRFRPGVKYIEDVRTELEKLRDKDDRTLPSRLLKGPPRGIKLAAFLTEQYRLEPTPGAKQYQDEVHLAGLVFANTLKQLESSPPAFQGIIQSLGEGLIARLRHVFGEEAQADIAPHLEWIRTSIFPSRRLDDNGEELVEVEDGDTLDASGEEVDAWLQQAVRSRKLERKLEGFTADHFDVERWKGDILSDLGFLREIHGAVLAARSQPDPKLSEVCPAVRRQVEDGRRVLVFTQSRRTAEYLERELTRRLESFSVARIDSRIGQDIRTATIHAFCPGYNPPPGAWPRGVPRRIDVLISTDVLSEGVNLQEAGAIVNYDIHWNPVRLIQRIGRVDRRLDPEITPEDHEFGIFNVVPPPEIEKIINLVESVERRTLKISRALGIDVSFFKASDPAGNLKEFNSYYEGQPTETDLASASYVRHFDTPDPQVQAMLDALPPGAFGVWGSAPFDGTFALFEMQPKPDCPERDRTRFEQVIGKPVLALERLGGAATTDAGRILGILSGTVEGERSANPSGETDLAARLRRLSNSVRASFADIELPSSIQPRLVCWMELRRGDQ